VAIERLIIDFGSVFAATIPLFLLKPQSWPFISIKYKKLST